MFIETPKNPKLKASTWSAYKHHQTLKVLVSIMPCGAFNFISEGWGGRGSDVVVTRESGFYDLLEYGDEVIADKGLIYNCRRTACQTCKTPYSTWKTRTGTNDEKRSVEDQRNCKFAHLCRAGN